MRPHRPASTKSTYRSLRDKQESNGRTLALDGNAWRNLRRSVLREQPLCEMCLRVEEVPVMATDVDHIDNDPSNNARDNLQSLCHSCHSKKTQAERGATVKWGWDENGYPLDPLHPWNEKSPATNSDKPSAPLHARSRERIEP